MEQSPEALDTTQLITDQIGSLADLAPFLIASLIGLLILFLVIAAIAARQHRRQCKAVLQTAEDIHAIRELLESQQKPGIRSRPPELPDDPQLPPRP